MIKKGVVADIAILCNHLLGGLLPDRVLVHTGDEGVSKFSPSFLCPKPRLSQAGALL